MYNPFQMLYGLRSSGVRWWERFSAILSSLGFVLSKAKDDLWMRDKGDHYEYIARYVDDLTIVSRDSKVITEALMGAYKLKLKGTGPIEYHLGCNFTRDVDGVLCMSPTKYIEWKIDTYYGMLEEKPKTIYTSPLEKGEDLFKRVKFITTTAMEAKCMKYLSNKLNVPAERQQEWSTTYAHCVRDALNNKRNNVSQDLKAEIKGKK
jgi:hypothetical protein